MFGVARVNALYPHFSSVDFCTVVFLAQKSMSKFPKGDLLT